MPLLQGGYVIQTDKAGQRFNTTQFEFANRIGPNKANNIILQVDTSKTFQTLMGFGGAFTDSATINIKQLPEDLQHTLLK